MRLLIDHALVVTVHGQDRVIKNDICVYRYEEETVALFRGLL
ncbi:MAG: hypothetical protein O6918_12290 [Deltaproteobacteria bacterium]|nr:hypothetical protein [Deltaproteobacteria bacterium]